jgi:hypothetical protein
MVVSDDFIIKRATEQTNKYKYLILPQDFEDAFNHTVVEGLSSRLKWSTLPDFDARKMEAFVTLDMRRGLLRHIYKEKDNFIEDYDEPLTLEDFEEFLSGEELISRVRSKLFGKKLLVVYDLLVSGMPRNEIIEKTGVQKSHFYGFYLKKIKKVLQKELFSAYNI